MAMNTIYFNAPPLADARLIYNNAIKTGCPQLCIFPTEAKCTQYKQIFEFIDKKLNIISFPAWDCLPFDRNSPDKNIIANRNNALSALQNGPKPNIIITSINAFTQRIQPKQTQQLNKITLKIGQNIIIGELLQQCMSLGYTPVQTARESGEVVRRGGLIDIFSANYDDPIRIDFLGNIIERISFYNPESQRRLGDITECVISQYGELPNNDNAIEKFKDNYRNAFGVLALKDYLIEQITMGFNPQGLEHYQPLFYETMLTLLDYCPPNTHINLWGDWQAHISQRLELIRDYYNARHDHARQYDEQLKRSKDSAHTGNPIRPLPVASLYIETDEVQALIESRSAHIYYDGAFVHGQDCNARYAPDFAMERNGGLANLWGGVLENIQANKTPTIITSPSNGGLQRIALACQEHGINAIIINQWGDIPKKPAANSCFLAQMGLERGIITHECRVIADADIFGQSLGGRAKRRKKAENYLKEINNLTPGDLVVHIDHGIGRFENLETIMVSGVPKDCLIIQYAKSKLFLPVENMDLISRFGNSDTPVELDTMGLGTWQQRVARTRKNLLAMAEKLMALAALRALNHAPKITLDLPGYNEFCARFPYMETEDQANAIADVITDLQDDQPMDRLICGDVGFGKTEVALRAAFVVADNGYQVVLICPTTLLARQHFYNFTERFRHTAIKIRLLSRFTGARESKIIKEEAANGQCDIIIGTHAVLSKTFKTHKLGLIIIDEEQHFGVTQKEKIKELGQAVHILTLSATPIPRTLQMAITGIRQLSLIATPPIDRLAVRTMAGAFDPIIVKEAITREINRGGQIFIVSPKVGRLPAIEQAIRDIMPNLRMTTAHGQMTAGDLEEAITDFADNKYDALLSTNIIESGIDMPSVNTIIIFHAEHFGLAQLYQLRGRVGRSKIRGFCYFSYPQNLKITDKSLKRLEILKSLDHLGAGFSLASSDLDLRGAGNLLGEEQSGHINEIGVELYQKLLAEAIEMAKQKYKKQQKLESPPKTENKPAEKPIEPAKNIPPPAVIAEFSPNISLGVAMVLPESYIADFNTRMNIYARLGECQNETELAQFTAECADRYGKPPVEFDQLCMLMAIKQYCRRAKIAKIQAGPRGAAWSFYQNNFPNPPALLQFIESQNGLITIKPDHSLVVVRDWHTPERRILGVRNLTAKLASLVK